MLVSSMNTEYPYKFFFVRLHIFYTHSANLHMKIFFSLVIWIDIGNCELWTWTDKMTCLSVCCCSGSSGLSWLCFWSWTSLQSNPHSCLNKIIFSWLQRENTQLFLIIQHPIQFFMIPTTHDQSYFFLYSKVKSLRKKGRESERACHKKKYFCVCSVVTVTHVISQVWKKEQAKKIYLFKAVYFSSLLVHLHCVSCKNLTQIPSHYRKESQISNPIQFTTGLHKDKKYLCVGDRVFFLVEGYIIISI